MVEIIFTVLYTRCEIKCVIPRVHQHQQKAFREQSPKPVPWHHEFVAVGDASPRHGANTYATQRGMSEIRTHDYIPDCSDLVPAALECF